MYIYVSKYRVCMYVCMYAWDKCAVNQRQVNCKSCATVGKTAVCRHSNLFHASGQTSGTNQNIDLFERINFIQCFQNIRHLTN